MAVRLADGRMVILDRVDRGGERGGAASGDDDGRARMLNNRGEFVFVGTWQEQGKSQTGVFVASPEGPALDVIPTANTLQLKFATEIGWKYQVQWSTNLSSG